MTVTTSAPSGGGEAAIPPEDLVTLTIDGIEISVPKGTLVIRAAELLGIEIPRFCDHPLLDPMRRLPPVHRRGRGPAQADGLLHHHLHRRHGRQVADHLSCRREGAEGRDGAAADQPSAGLPRLRQGRRVPAPEPGDVARRRRLPLRGQEADLREARPDLHPGAAGPRAVRALRALHPVLQPGGGRPDDRADRARRAPAGRHRRGRPLRVVLLRQHHPDLPGRRADLGGVPIPLPPLRPGLHPLGVRAVRGRLLDPDRPPARQGHASPRGQRARGQRGVDLRQGAVRLPLRPAARPAHHPAGPQRRGRAGTGELARGAGSRGGRTPRRPRPYRRPDRRPH